MCVLQSGPGLFGADAPQSVKKRRPYHSHVYRDFVALAVQKDYGCRHYYRNPFLKGDDGVDAFNRNGVEWRGRINRVYAEFFGLRVDVYVVMLCGVVEQQNQVEHVHALRRFVVAFVE